MAEMKSPFSFSLRLEKFFSLLNVSENEEVMWRMGERGEKRRERDSSSRNGRLPRGRQGLEIKFTYRRGGLRRREQEGEEGTLSCG